MTLLVWRYTKPSVDSSSSHVMTLYQTDNRPCGAGWPKDRGKRLAADVIARGSPVDSSGSHAETSLRAP